MPSRYLIATTVLTALLCVAWYVHLQPGAQVVAHVSVDSMTASPVAPTNTARPSDTIVVPVTREGSVLEAMRAYAAVDNTFTFSTTGYPSLGSFVTAIDGRRNANSAYWTLYINGTYSELGASSAHVHAGDTIEWRYQTSVE